MSDRSPMFDYICGFSHQLRIGYPLGEQIPLPQNNIASVVFCGMGGSAIAGDLLGGYAKSTMKIPFFVNRFNKLPAFVNDRTLVIISSYSGNTEETLSCYSEALYRKSPILAITSGGKLRELCVENDNPMITIPGGLPPRAALGYSFSPLYAVFKRYGFIKNTGAEIYKAANSIEKLTGEYSSLDSPPARLAAKLQNKIPIFYAVSSGFEAVVTRFRCQLAENTKTLAFGNCYPELSHNEIVGWGSPKLLKKSIAAVFLGNNLQIDPFKKQADVIKKILKSEKIPVYNISIPTGGKLTGILAFVHFADWLSYHLAVLKGVDPIPIERIDLLKKQMLKIENS